MKHNTMSAEKEDFGYAEIINIEGQGEEMVYTLSLQTEYRGEKTEKQYTRSNIRKLYEQIINYEDEDGNERCKITLNDIDYCVAMCFEGEYWNELDFDYEFI